MTTLPEQVDGKSARYSYRRGVRVDILWTFCGHSVDILWTHLQAKVLPKRLHVAQRPMDRAEAVLL